MVLIKPGFMLSLAMSIFLFAVFTVSVYAQEQSEQTTETESIPKTEIDTSELRSKIDEKNSAIEEIEKEIEKYQKELETIGGQKKTLQSEISKLELTRKKLLADISLNETKISRANLKLEKLTSEIGDKTSKVDVSRKAIAQSIKIINENDQVSVPEIFLSAKTIDSLADTMNELEIVEVSLRDYIVELEKVKSDLEASRMETQSLKTELVSLKNKLADNKKVVEYNKKETTALLNSTKNSETTYKKLLDEKIALRDAFERELLEFESQLKLIIDPSSIPEAKKGLLAWPLSKVVITQLFGNTKFAQQHAAVYNGQGHNGVDFDAPTGTEIKAALSGVVDGTGDTDRVCPGASYGKWVLIKHSNGLSTLYAHFSFIKVNEGDSVETGQVIGYSGSTGYSTGPHLHFTVYATQGVKIMERKSRVCLGNYKMPIADLKAYLNPLEYLPEYKK